VAVLLDTGVLFAYFDRSDSWHGRVLELFKREHRGLILPAPVIVEVDHLLGTRLPAAARMTFYRSLSGGSYHVADLPKEKYVRIEELHRHFASLSLGFVDAAVIAISESLGLPRIATTDRRHFAPLATAFRLELLP